MKFNVGSFALLNVLISIEFYYVSKRYYIKLF